MKPTHHCRFRIIPLSCLIRNSITAALLAISALQSHAESFRIVVIPDTQWASQKWPHLISNMTQWIAENHVKEDIRYVLHVGDMVQTGNNDEEWKSFDSSMRILEEAKVPSILAVGNHDLDKVNPGRSTVFFNRYFPVERISKNAGFGGNHPDGKSDNSFATFEGGGKKWLILSLNYMPADDELAWGNQVIARHPDHQVILLTHSYLTHGGKDIAGETCWQRLLRWHPNVAMVFCGHLSTVHFRSEGDHGNTVCEMLFDWQNDREPDPNSYLAIVTIDPQAKTISSRSYSPTLNHELSEGRTGITNYQNVVFLPGNPEAAAKAAAEIAQPRK